MSEVIVLLLFIVGEEFGLARIEPDSTTKRVLENYPERRSATLRRVARGPANDKWEAFLGQRGEEPIYPARPPKGPGARGLGAQPLARPESERMSRLETPNESNVSRTATTDPRRWAVTLEGLFRP
jgi:hypothetical protein